jgi:hypothetical protein
MKSVIREYRRVLLGFVTLLCTAPGASAEWLPNGTPVVSATGWQSGTQMTSDGAGGAIIVWTDARSGYWWDVYAQSIDALGDVQWKNNGVDLRPGSTNALSPAIATDAAGGAIVAWRNVDVYAQWISYRGFPRGFAVPISPLVAVVTAAALASLDAATLRRRRPARRWASPPPVSRYRLARASRLPSRASGSGPSTGSTVTGPTVNPIGCECSPFPSIQWTTSA